MIVRVIVDGDQMTIDLSGVGAQVAGYFNSGPTAGRSAAEVAFKCLTTPLLLPINDGAFRPLKIILPPIHHRDWRRWRFLEPAGA